MTSVRLATVALLVALTFAASSPVKAEHDVIILTPEGGTLIVEDNTPQINGATHPSYLTDPRDQVKNTPNIPNIPNTPNLPGGSGTAVPATVPEPSSLLLFALGLGGLALFAKRRRI